MYCTHVYCIRVYAERALAQFARASLARRSHQTRAHREQGKQKHTKHTKHSAQHARANERKRAPRLASRRREQHSSRFTIKAHTRAATPRRDTSLRFARSIHEQHKRGEENRAKQKRRENSFKLSISAFLSQAAAAAPAGHRHRHRATLLGSSYSAVPAAQLRVSSSDQREQRERVSGARE